MTKNPLKIPNMQMVLGYFSVNNNIYLKRVWGTVRGKMPNIDFFVFPAISCSFKFIGGFFDFLLGVTFLYKKFFSLSPLQPPFPRFFLYTPLIERNILKNPPNCTHQRGIIAGKIPQTRTFFTKNPPNYYTVVPKNTPLHYSCSICLQEKSPELF
jgi:hypothetical protein